jgi:hypothetical protein
MERAIKYIEQFDIFLTLLRKVTMKNHAAIETIIGRKFDRIVIDGAVTYFVDKKNSVIYGTKSPLQYNPRRSYGTLDTVMQFDWTTNTPLPGSPVEAEWNAREKAIQSGYKKRGRPRKVVHVQPTSIEKVSAS